MGEHPYIGQTVDGYVIEDLLGQGGMASVYRGLDTSLGRSVAIKILPADALGDEDLVKRFEREAHLIAQVNHPNIAQVYRIGMIGNCPYYAMEHIDGYSLADLLLERDRLTPMQAINYMIQTAKGLKAAAERQIIHRDIKPANIMLTRDGTIKIVDFGIAKAHRDETYKTMAGHILGTPRYMSPEQGRGLPVDFRSDMYSLGATFYHMLAGVPPFDSDNPITLVLKHAKDPVQAIEQFNDRITERTQCPPDFPAVGLMVALAAVVGRKVGIRPKHQDDWMVVPNLWGAVIGRPGILKTPVLQESLAPLKRLEITAKKAFEDETKESEIQQLVAKQRAKNIDKQIEKALKNGNEAEAERLARELADKPCPTPVRLRFLVNDSTVEKLGVLLNENPYVANRPEPGASRGSGRWSTDWNSTVYEVRKNCNRPHGGVRFGSPRAQSSFRHLRSITSTMWIISDQSHDIRSD